MRKIIAFGIILFVLGISSIQYTVSVAIQEEQSTNGCMDGIELHGWMGNNGWYRSNVEIIFNFTEQHTHIFYKIDEGEWNEYTVPIVVCNDGEHTVRAYYMDIEGNQSEIYSAIFKIDQTAPIINGIFCERLNRHTYKFYAEVNDTTSGMNKVEFYMNDCFMVNDSTAPYEWIYKGPSFSLGAIIYDNAGNSKLEVIPSGPIRFSAIGFIENVSISTYDVYFYAKFILVYEGHSFMILTNQQYMIYTSYKGYIGENFMMIRYKRMY